MHSRIHKRDGFSFTEIAIVILILAILSAVAVPRFQESLSRASLDAACKRLAADLEFARSNAIAKSATTTVEFRIAPINVYEMPDVADRSNPSQSYLIELHQQPYRCQIASANFDGKPNVSFNGFGNPDFAGSIELVIGKFTRVVSVSQNGIIQIHDVRLRNANGLKASTFEVHDGEVQTGI